MFIHALKLFKQRNLVIQWIIVMYWMDLLCIIIMHYDLLCIYSMDNCNVIVMYHSMDNCPKNILEIGRIKYTV